MARTTQFVNLSLITHKCHNSQCTERLVRPPQPPSSPPPPPVLLPCTQLSTVFAGTASTITTITMTTISGLLAVSTVKHYSMLSVPVQRRWSSSCETLSMWRCGSMEVWLEYPSNGKTSDYWSLKQSWCSAQSNWPAGHLLQKCKRKDSWVNDGTVNVDVDWKLSTFIELLSIMNV